MSGSNPRIVIHGAGRMGRQVFEQSATLGCEVVAVVARNEQDWIPQGLYQSTIEQALASADVVIDFSLPPAMAKLVSGCVEHRVALLSGTTGLGEEEQALLKQASASIPVLHASNFSKGVNVMLWLVSQAADMLGPETKALITDIHHVHKIDAPSGTALSLQAALGDRDNSIESRREGEVIGEHEVEFSVGHECLAVSHKALDRSVFARGAVEAATWLAGKKSGLYDAGNWIGAGEENKSL